MLVKDEVIGKHYPYPSEKTCSLVVTTTLGAHPSMIDQKIHHALRLALHHVSLPIVPELTTQLAVPCHIMSVYPSKMLRSGAYSISSSANLCARALDRFS